MQKKLALQLKDKTVAIRSDMKPSFALPVGTNPDLSDIKSVLVVVAHPDDIDFGCAGTVSALTSQGLDVSYCLVTSGDAGGDKDDLSREERMSVRETEQSNAGKKVGVSNIHFLRQPDGTVESNLALREKITRVIRKEKPDLVITQSPKRRYDRIYASHPDHLATGDAVICACYPDSQNPHAYPNLLDEGYEPHAVKAIWIMVDEEPDVFVDTTDHFEKKMEALMEHKSQIEDQEFVKKMMKDWGKSQAELSDLGQEKLAESYRFVQISQ